MACGESLRKVNLKEFLKSLSASGDEVCAELVEVIGTAAYRLPLPPHWTEEVDEHGVVYFWHNVLGEASWTHPMLSLFEQTLLAASRIVQAAWSIEHLMTGISAHLKEAEAKADQAVRGWTGPHLVNQQHADPSHSEYFYNQITGESCWENPLEVPQFVLQTQFQLLVFFLHYMHDKRLTGSLGQVAGPATPTETPREGSGSSPFPTPTPTPTANANTGVLDNVISASELPDEMQEYVRWIKLSLAAAVPAAEPALQAKRSALPSLTELSLGATPASSEQDTTRRPMTSTAVQEVRLRTPTLPAAHKEAGRFPQGSSQRAAASWRRSSDRPSTLRQSESDPRLRVRGKTSLPPLTALPLNRTMHTVQVSGVDRLPPRPLGPHRVASAALLSNVQPLQ